MEVDEVMLGKVMDLIWNNLSVFNEPGHPFYGALVSSRYDDALLINKKRDQLIAIPSWPVQDAILCFSQHSYISSPS
jgi:hypothetical protein